MLVGYMNGTCRFDVDRILLSKEFPDNSRRLNAGQSSI